MAQTDEDERLLSQLGRQNVLMVSDFFYPSSGGVENHIYHLAQCLLNHGHKVVILTHAYGSRNGVRHMTNGLKVYYVPRMPFYSNNTFPTVLGGFRMFRQIMIREQITIVHAHQAFSVLGHEAILHARTMGYKTVFTDHSLYGFADWTSILTNKLLRFTMCDCQHLVCVSYTSKENTVLRGCVPPHRVSVIPNAVDTSRFTPDPKAAPRLPTIRLIVMSRLVYRKGVDLLLHVVPEICKKYSNVCWTIGGDGPKRQLLEDMVAEEGLRDRVLLLGNVAHDKVRDVLVTGHMFVNTSLTETFCIAMLEAASCGLLVVSTAVGGVPEVLPAHMVVLARPDGAGLTAAVEEGLPRVPHVDPLSFHQQVKEMYSWEDTCKRVEIVYARALKTHDDSLIHRWHRMYQCGRWAGKIFCCVLAVDYMLWRWVNYWYPQDSIDIAPDYAQCKSMLDAAAPEPTDETPSTVRRRRAKTPASSP